MSIPEKNKASLLSIPRDSMMLVPAGDGSYFQDRINTAYVYNWSSQNPDAAPAALAETIERNLGIKVDYRVDLRPARRRQRHRLPPTA